MLAVLSMGIFSYLCGSLPTGKLVARRYGIDIQRRGSGNIGFANVLRVIGWRAAIPTLVVDIAKGFLPTYMATVYFGASTGFIIGICAIMGHIFPIWLRFKGGKGIATGLGVLLGTTPLVGAIGFGVYIIFVLLFRRSSYASFAAGIAVVISGMITSPTYAWAYILLICIATITLRKNLFGTVQNYDT